MKTPVTLSQLPKAQKAITTTPAVSAQPTNPNPMKTPTPTLATENNTLNPQETISALKKAFIGGCQLALKLDILHQYIAIAIDSDGLPQSIEMQITMPSDKKQGSSDTRIATTFYNYARTGLALQKLAHNPFYMFGNLVGSDVSTVRSLLLGCIAVLLLIVGVSVLFAMRRKLYLPMAILVVGIMLFQPFSTIPRTLAASQTPPVAPRHAQQPHHTTRTGIQSVGCSLQSRSGYSATNSRHEYRTRHGGGYACHPAVGTGCDHHEF